MFPLVHLAIDGQGAHGDSWALKGLMPRFCTVSMFTASGLQALSRSPPGDFRVAVTMTMMQDICHDRTDQMVIAPRCRSAAYMTEQIFHFTHCPFLIKELLPYVAWNWLSLRLLLVSCVPAFLWLNLVATHHPPKKQAQLPSCHRPIALSTGGLTMDMWHDKVILFRF